MKQIELRLSDEGRDKFFYTLVHVLQKNVIAVGERARMHAVDKHVFEGGNRKKSTPEFVLVPSEGRFYLSFKSSFLFFDITPDESVSDSHKLHHPQSMEDVIVTKKTVTISWNASTEIFGEADVVHLINEVYGRHGNPKVWTHSCYDWVQRGELSGSIDHLFFSDELGQKIVTSIENFMSKQERFKKFDRIFKKTFLLQGPPGTGKTSLIRAIAKHFHRDLYVINMSDRTIGEQILDLVQKVPPNSIVAVEDLDRFFENGETTAEASMTTSAMLNVFDGFLSASNGLITFITANHPEHLPSALIRQGRVDEVIYVDGNVTLEQFEASFRAVVEDDVEPEPALYEIVRVQKLTMADVMSVLFTGDTPEDRLKIARSIKRSRRFASDSSMFV